MTEGKKSNAVLYWILGIIGAVIVIAVVLILLLRKKKKDDDSTNYGNTSMDTTEKGAGWDVATAAVKSLGGLFANKVALGLSRDEKIQACSALLIDLKKIPASKKAESERALAKLTNAELNTVLKKLSNEKKQVVAPGVFANNVASGLSRDEKIQACSALLIDLKKIPASKKAESERALAKLTNAELNTVLKKLSNDKKQVVDPRVNEKVSAIITKYRFSINL